MNAISQVLKNFNLFVDGRSLAGQCEEVTLPNLVLTEEEFRAGGMDAPIAVAMGMEKLEMSFKMLSFDSDIMKLWGATSSGRVSLTFRGALQDLDGATKALVINARGRIHKLEFDSVTAGAKVAPSYMCACDTFKLTKDGEVIHDIDVANCVRIVDGVDQLKAMRDAIGII